MYTLKSLGEIEEGIAARMETEVLVDGPIDIPEGIPVKQTRKPVGSIIFLRKLLKHLQVCTDRRRYRP